MSADDQSFFYRITFVHGTADVELGEEAEGNPIPHLVIAKSLVQIADSLIGQGVADLFTTDFDDRGGLA